MKKVIKLLALSLAMVFVLACFPACGDSDTYIIATDTTFPPFEFTNDKDVLVGIDVDLLDAIAKDQGFKYELRPLGFDAAVAALESGQADAVIAGMSINEKRQEKYNFSNPYYESGVGMAVLAEDNSIQSYNDLKDKTVAVKAGTEGKEFAESIAETYGFKVQTYEDSALMYEAVKSKKAVACFEDFPVMAYGIAQGNGFRMISEKPERPSNYGFAVLKGAGNDELVEMFNKGLENIKANGTYQEILDKYLKAN